MGFKYIGGLATPENVGTLLSLIDKVAGSKVDAQNVFDIEDVLGADPQLQNAYRPSLAIRHLLS